MAAFAAKIVTRKVPKQVSLLAGYCSKGASFFMSFLPKFGALLATISSALQPIL